MMNVILESQINERTQNSKSHFLSDEYKRQVYTDWQLQNWGWMCFKSDN